MNRKKVYALALAASLMMGIVPGTAAEGTVEEVIANFTGAPIISTDSDFHERTIYPAIVNVGGSLSITIDNLQFGDVIRIMGEKLPIMARVNWVGSDKKTISWEPMPGDEGIYKIQVLRYTGKSDGLKSLEEAASKAVDGWIDLEDLKDFDNLKDFAELLKYRVKAERKLYVNPTDRNNLMQLGDLKVKTSHIGTPFNTMDSSELMSNQVTTPGAYQLEPQVTTPAAYQLQSPKWSWSGVEISAPLKSSPAGSQVQTKFTISEPGIWSRQIRSLGGYNNTIQEYRDFIAGSGRYSVLAEVKDWNSIEAEDYKTTSFSKDYVNVVPDSWYPSEWIKVHKVTLKEVENKDGYFTVKAECNQDCKEDSFEYAFLIEDDLGLTKMNQEGYTKSNKVQETGLAWNHKIVARVKHKVGSDKPALATERTIPNWLPNSFEAQIVKEFTYEGVGSLLEGVIVTPTYNAHKANSEDGAIKKDKEASVGGTVPVIAGEKNYITILPKSTDSNIRYKAWVIDDGVIIPLGEYSKDNEFVYYPKSGVGENKQVGEKQKLVVSVKKVDSNGNTLQKDTGEFVLNVY